MPGLEALLNAPETEQQIARLMGAHGGDAAKAHLASYMERGAPEGKNDRGLRNAEHALFAQSIIDKLGPVAGRTALAGAVPGYTAVKALAQNSPPGYARALEMLTRFPLTRESGASAPGLDELYWGLRPVFKSVR